MATKPVRIGYGEAAAAAGILLCEGDARAFYNAHGVRLGSPGWADDSHSIAVTFRSGPRHLPFSLHVMFNAYWEALDFDLPPAPAAAIGGWRRWIDTSLGTARRHCGSRSGSAAAGNAVPRRATLRGRAVFTNQPPRRGTLESGV
jgi:pullulanase/glycogen debranching enzyme